MAKTVLIVEDNELNMKLFHDLLEAHGYNTVGTRNGIEALELARKHRPDLVLMDIQMPVMDGYQATQAMRQWERDQQRRPTPIVSLTANAFQEDIEKSLAAGCTAHLTKPIKKKTLLAVMDRCLVPPSSEAAA